MNNSRKGNIMTNADAKKNEFLERLRKAADSSAEFYAIAREIRDTAENAEQEAWLDEMLRRAESAYIIEQDLNDPESKARKRFGAYTWAGC